MKHTNTDAASLRRLTTIVAGALALSTNLQAQESIRPSLTGAAAAEARRPAFRTQPNYNYKAGPVFFDLRGDLGIEFNDNVNLSDDDRKADLILRPQLTLSSFWQVTPLNALRLDIGVGYAKYINEQELDSNSVLISPNSQISFDVFVGDFRINFHDRFSIQQDPLDEIELSNEGDFSRFENSAGISVLWDLNDVKLVFGYDHYTFKSISGNFDYLDRSEEQFTFSAQFLLTDATSVGLDAGVALFDYDEDYHSDGVSYHIGPFFETQISNYLRLRLAAGYQAIEFDSDGFNQDDSDANGPYANLTLAHRLNNYYTQTFSTGYESRLGLTSNAVDLAFVRYTGSWRMNRAITMNFDAFFEDSSESGGILAEDAQRFGAGVGFDYQLTRKLLVGLRYQFNVKDSDLDNRDYYQNRVLLNLGYDF
jgi:hypothetical protein